MVKQSQGSSDVIVVFDSGVGGLNLLAQCVKLMPEKDYYYISDNQNVPYGNRPADEVLRLVLAALDGIESLNPQALVIACNTATALCIDNLRARFSFPVVGIQPAIKQASKVGGRCLVLATEGTVHSSSFFSLAARFPDLETVVVGCKSLASYIEENIFNLPAVLPDGLLPNVKADSVVLGCTHYSYVAQQISEFYSCPVFDGIVGTANRCSEICGMSDHQLPRAGVFDHICYNKLKITFLRGNNKKNEQIIKYLFSIMSKQQK